MKRTKSDTLQHLFIVFNVDDDNGSIFLSKIVAEEELVLDMVTSISVEWHCSPLSLPGISSMLDSFDCLDMNGTLLGNVNQQLPCE